VCEPNHRPHTAGLRWANLGRSCCGCDAATTTPRPVRHGPTRAMVWPAYSCVWFSSVLGSRIAIGTEYTAVQRPGPMAVAWHLGRSTLSHRPREPL
jgi:hypothetical protein